MSDEKKALERLHTDNSHVPGPGMDERTWLNTASVVNNLLREFVFEVIQNVENTDGFQQWLELECRRLNNLFLGISPSPAYSTGPWNTPEQCGEYVLRALQINGSSRLAVRDALFVLTSRVLAMAAKSDDFDGEALDAEIDRVRHALLGTSEVA